MEDLVESHAKRLHPDCLHREKEASLRHTFSNLSIFCCGEPTLSVSLSAALNTSEFPNGEPFCQTCHIPSSLFIPFPHPPATPALEPPPLALPRLPSACLRHSIKCSFSSVGRALGCEDEGLLNGSLMANPPLSVMECFCC